MELLEPRLLLTSNPIISEFLASNQTGLTDSGGNQSDWIEIYNPDSHDLVDLTGWKLRYKSSNDWSFPSMTLGPGEFRIIFCDETNQNDPNGELHATFKLDKDHQRLRLLNPLGVAVQDFNEYPDQSGDVSYGVGQAITETKLLDTAAATRYYAPSDDSLGQSWKDPGFVDTSWTQGISGLGFANYTPGFAVREYKASSITTITSLAGAQAVIDNPATQSWSQTETTPSINYYNTGSRGHFIYDTTFPELRIGVAQYNYVVKATGTIHVSAADSTWTFGVNSDDGFRLGVTDSATGAAVSFSNAYVSGTLYNGAIQYDGVRTANDTLGTITFPAAGDYDLNLFYYQGNSSAEVELFAAQGAFNSWAGTSAWRLVGDTANDGMAVNSPPFSGPAMSVASLAESNVRQAMQAASQHTSLYTRTLFDAPNWDSMGSLTLKMAYDDGYVAYINGVEVARKNVLASVFWNSEATAARTSEVQSSTFETVDLSTLLNPANPYHLQPTGNVLAVQVLNVSPTDGDLLMLPEISQISSSQLGLHFFDPPTPTSANAQQSWEKAKDPQFSVEHGFYDDPFALTLSTNTPGSVIYYTTDSSAPWNPNTYTLLTTQISRSLSTATVTLNNHGYANGDVIQVTGTNQLEYNGVFTIFNVTLHTFSYAVVPTAPTTSTGAPTLLKVDKAVSGITRSALTVTVTTPAAHGFVDNDLVRILGANQPEYDGDFMVTVLNAYAFTYTLSSYAGTPVSPATGGLAAFKLGQQYLAPIPITTTTTVRARVYNAAYEPSDSVTQSYIYLNDVITQPANPAGYPTNWGAVPTIYPADYEMDPRITQDPAYKGLLRDALTALPTISIVGDRSGIFDANIGLLTSSASVYASNASQPPVTAVSVEYFDPNGDEDGFQINAGVSVYGNAGRNIAYKKLGLRLRFKDDYGPSKLEYPIFGDDATDQFDTLILRCSYGDMWTIGGSYSYYIRDAYGAATQLALEQPGRHAQFVHVYIDGLYWGLYDMAERPDDAFAASYFGGDKDDWEASNSGYDNLAPKIYNIPYWNTMLADTKVGFATTTSQGGVPGFNTTLYAAAASATPGFTSIVYRASGNVLSLGNAETVIITPAQQLSTATQTATTVNYLNAFSDAHFSGNNNFPGMTTAEVDNFVMETTSSITIPTSGYWTFGVSSDDSFRMTLTNGVDTYTFYNDGVRPGPADKIQPFNITSPGDYRMRLVYFQNTGGAEMELFAAQGNFSTYAATPNWRLVGDTAGGGLASYVVTTLNSLADAESIISTPAKQAWTKSQVPATVNYLTTGVEGHYGGNIVFPGTISGTPLQSFVVKLESTISIPTTGWWTFAVSSDDGFHLTLMDGVTTVLDSYYDGLRTAGDTFKSYNFTKTGSYTLRLVYFQSTTPGAELELYASKGNYTLWGSASTWQLVGNNVRYTAPTMANAGLLSLAAPVTLTNLSDAENVLTPIFRTVNSLWPTKTSATITRSGSTATVTMPDHGLVSGQAVLISGVDQVQYNGTYVIANVTNDTFDYTLTGTPASPATGDIFGQPYGISRSGASAIVWRPNHGYGVGDYVRLAGVSQGDYNGTFRITAATTNTFTFGLAGVPASPATGTAITVTKVYQAWTFSATLNTVNYITTGADGRFGGSAAFPGTVAGNLLENFAVESNTTISIPAGVSTTGQWTFGVNSDEGFSLTLTNGTDTYYGDYNSLRTPGDTLVTFGTLGDPENGIPANPIKPGMYRVRLVYFQKTAGAEVELYAAPGEWSAWNQTTAWRLVGDMGGLGTSLSNLAMVTTYQANVPVTSLEDADLVAQDTALQIASTTEYRNMVNLTTSDNDGRFGASESFPGLSSTETDDFVVRVQATVTIPTAGAWTFAVSCDDGFRLTLYDGVNPLAPVMQRSGVGDLTDSVEIFNLPRTGNFNFELLYYQHTGDAGLELSATPQAAPKAIYGVGAPVAVPNRTVTSITRFGLTATVTSAGHGLSNGDAVLISGASDAAYNGPFTIGNVTTDTFTYTVSGTPDSPATGTILAARIATISRSGTIATVTSANHGFATGDVILISGANETAYNGTFTVTVTGPNAFTYSVSGSPASPATGSVTASMAGITFQSPKSITSITRSGLTATVTLTAHGFVNGDTVKISGATQSEYNGSFVIGGVSANSFTYTVPATPTTPATGTLFGQSSMATVTLHNHGFTSGQVVLITGANQPEYNGYVKIVTAASNAFTYMINGTPVSPATGAIATQTATLGGPVAVSAPRTFSSVGTTSAIAGPKAVTSITRNTTTVTVTLNGHGYANNNVILISGADQPEYNGAFTIAGVATNTFQYTISSGAPLSPATGSSLGAITTKNVASISRSGTTATVNCTSHGYLAGNMVRITGATPAEYNGVFAIVNTGTNTFSYTVSDLLAASATGTIVASNAGITRNGSTATVTLNNHGFVTGQTVLISGATQSEYNGFFPITYIGVNTFSYPVAETASTPATGAITAQTSSLAAIPATKPTVTTLKAVSSPGTASTVTSITRSGDTATATLTNHGFVSGQTVYISGATQPEYNGYFPVTYINANSFSYLVSGTPASPATTGTSIKAQSTGLVGTTRSPAITSIKNVSSTGSSVNVSNITCSGSTATVTTAASHGYVNGQTIYISGATQTDYNGYFPITYLSTTSFSYTVTGTPDSPATGTITARPSSLATRSTLTSITRSGGTATATLASHYYVSGQTIVISGAAQPDYNGTFSITVLDANRFTYSISTSAAASATGTLYSQPYGISSNGNTAIVSLPGHAYVVGDMVYISGATQPEYNGSFPISYVTTNTFTYTISGTPTSPATGTVTAQLARVTRNNNTVTVTLNNHGYVNGQTIVITGAAQPEYNGAFAISNVTANTFDYTISGTPVSPATGANIYAQPYGISLYGMTAIVYASGHGYVTGNVINVSGALQPEYNGSFAITVLNGNTFSYTLPSGTPTSPANGIVTAQLPKVVRNGSTVTVTLSSHGYVNGQTILISGAVQPEYNGTFSILNVTTSTFDYAITSTPVSPATGTISAQSYGLFRNGATVIASYAGHGYLVGDIILVSGANPPEYNGTFTITSVTPNTFTYGISDTPTSPATGTILVTKWGLVRNGQTATATVMNHGFIEGQTVLITGAAQAEYNGSFKIFNVTANTFDYAVTGAPVSPATGTVYVQQPYGISLASDGTTAIVSVAAHGFALGDPIRVTDADQPAYNGTFTVTSANLNAFTYTVAGTPASPATGTTISASSLAFSLSTFRLVGDTLNGGLTIGSTVSIEDMYYFLQGENPDGTRNPNYPILLDVDNYIDYLLSQFYVGNGDWPAHNFYAARLDTDESTGYKFFSWDTDASLGVTSDTTRLSTGVAQPYYYLCGSPEFRMRFADHAQKFLFNGGALTPTVAAARFQKLIDEINLAMIAESARWGDIPTSPGPLPHTVVEWRTSVNSALTAYFPFRTANLITILKNDGLYPSVDGVTFYAPTFAVNGVAKYGGTFPLGAGLTMSTTTGTILYCPDGSDPRLPGGGIRDGAVTYDSNPIMLTETRAFKVRAYSNGTWSALADVVFYLDLSPSIRITELMYNPANPTADEIAAGFSNNDDFEFIEIKNIGTDSVPLGGLYLANGVDYTFPDVTIEPGQCLVVAANPAAFMVRYPDRAASLVDEVTGYTGHLDNAGEKVELDSPVGGIIQEFTYNDGWYAPADGEGFSLTVRDPAQALSTWDDSDGWRSSAAPGGTPGTEDTLLAPGSVIINEILPHTDLPQVDTIEFYNTTDLAIDVGGWFVSDLSTELMKYEIAAGTIIAPHGYLVLTADNFNNAGDPGCHEAFLLSEYGEDVYLSSNAAGVAGGYREHVDFSATPNGVAQGLYVKSSGGTDFTLLQTLTLGAANATIPYIAPLVINQIMYHPTAPTAEETAAGFTNSDDFEYLELYNRTEGPLTLSDFYVGGGVGFTFGWYADGTSNEYWTLEPEATATWTPSSIASDTYTVSVHYTLLSGDGTRRKLDDKAQYTINTVTGPVVVTVDQNQPGVSGDDLWVTLGTFALDSTAWVKLTRGDTGADNWTIAEEVEFSHTGPDVHVYNPTFDSFSLRSGLTTLAPNAYLVLVKNYAAFDARYDIVGNSIPVVGVYTGNMNNGGDKLGVYQFGVPDPNIVPAYRVDYVNYDTSGDWPGRADGEGSALFRVHPAAYGNEPSNWQSSATGIRPGQPAVRLDKSAPSVPSNLAAISAVAPANQITLSWAASADNQSYVDHYLVYRGAALGVVVYTTSYVDTNVQATTPYSYRVSAVNRDGYESALCDPVTVSIPGIVSYATPEGRIEITFSEPLRADTASVPANYSINGTAPTGVTLAVGNTKVVLTTNAFDSTTLLASGATGKVLVPTGNMGTAWTATSYDDSGWTAATTGIGFEIPLPNEIEPNDSTATASSATRNFGSFTGNLYFLGLGGTADAAGSGDDWFKLGAMDVGDVLTISGSGAPSSRGASSNVYIELWRAGDTVNYVAMDDDSGPGLDALIARRTITTADTYYVKIRRYNTSVVAGTYALNVWLEDTGTAPATGGTLNAELEANDYLTSPNNAAFSWRPVQYLSRTTGTISTTGDIDYYKYSLMAGDLVTFNIDSTSSLEAKVSLLDGSGTLVVGLEDGTSGFVSPYDLDAPLYSYIVPTTGIYYLKVESTGSTAGTYNADVYLASFTPPPIFTPMIGTNLKTQMYGVNSTAYLRVPFNVADLSAFNKLRLRVKYDDGFVAYLNGTEIARRNAPSTTGWNSAATAARADAQSTMYEEIDITAFLSALRAGANVLAIQALNQTAADSDLLIVPELVGTQVGAHYTVTMSNLATQSSNEISSPVQVGFDYVPQGSGSVLREYWTVVTGVNVADLTGSGNFPNTPTGKTYPSMLEAPYNWADSYGTRIRGYVYPPMTGSYTFWIAGDDTAELWLSTDDNPANKQKIAFVGSAGTNTYRKWDNFPTAQQSVAISLAAGQRYYIEILQKDSGATDNCSVRWQLPDGSWENADLNAPIPGVRLSPYGAMPDMTPPSVPQHLSAQLTGNNTQVTLSWDASYDPDYHLARYVIYRDGISYGTSTTTSFIDTSVSPSARHRYQVTAVNTDNFESAYSLALSVAPLGVAAVGAFSLNTVQITYSEAVDRVSAELLANYAIVGVTISSAHLEADSLTVTLTTPTLALNTNYTATINGVLSATGALIASSFQQTFRVGGAVLREYWLNVGTVTGTYPVLYDLTSNANYPNNPTGREYRTQYFEAPTNWTTNYGERDRAYLVPDVTGNYTFWIASDDASQLLLSTTAGHTADPSYAVQIAQATAATGSRQWNYNQAQQKSASILLTAGQQYYFEALMKQRTGNSNLAVAWQRPDAPSYPNKTVAISRSLGTATVTLNNHGFVNGQTILISGASQTEYNGTFVISYLDANRFTYTILTTPATPATGAPVANSTFITRSSSTATVRIPSHGFVNGDYVAISGALQSEYNGAFLISGVTADTFNITVSASAASPATGTLAVSKLLPIPASYLMPYSPTYPSVTGASIARAGDTATVTLNGHGFSNGQTILISGATQAAYNGTFAISNVATNTFTYTVTGTPASPATTTTTIAANAAFILRSGSTATVTMPSHGFVNGNYVAISGANQAEYNGAFLISGVTANTFNITVTGNPLSPATGTLSANKLLPLSAGSSPPYSLINITGGAFSGTIDQQGTTDATPAMEGTVSDGSVSVTVGVGGVYYAATNNGNATWNLPAGTIRTPLADGTYPVSVCFSDATSRVGFDSTTNELIVDHVLPTANITGFGSAMRNTPVAQVQFVFNEAVSGFGLADLRFSRAGGSDLLTAAESLTSTDNITWTLSGLPAQSLLDVPYTLTLLGTGSKIEDAAGNEPAGDIAATWTIHTTPPTVVVSPVTPNLRNSAVAQIAIVFDEWVAGLDLADLRLTRDGGANLLTGAQTITTSDHVTWTLGGVSGITGLSGDYVLSLVAANSAIQDAASNLLAVDAGTSWSTDSVAPTAVIDAVSPNPRNTAVTTPLTITFSETVQGFDLAKLALTLNGGPNLLTASQTPTTSDNVHWTLDNLAALTATQGNYSLTISSTGVTDTVGNVLQTVTACTWTVDTTAPTGSIAAVTPNPRDTTVAQLAITFSEPVPIFPLGNLSFSFNGGPNLLTASQTIETSDGGIHWALGNLAGLTGSQGSYTLTLSPAGIADQVGNAMLTGDSTSWSMIISDLDADGNGRADALTDGILILRYMFDPSGQWNYSDALGSGATRTSRTTIKNYLDGGKTLALDADGNGRADALTDGILILRYLFDPSGQWNYSDALGSGAIRTSRVAIRSYLDQYNPAMSGLLAAASVPSSTPTADGQLLAAAAYASSTPAAEAIADDPQPASNASLLAVDAVLQQWTPPATGESPASELVQSTAPAQPKDDADAEDHLFAQDDGDWFLQTSGKLT